MSSSRQESDIRTQSPYVVCTRSLGISLTLSVRPSVLTSEHAAGVFQVPAAPIAETSSRYVSLYRPRYIISLIFNSATELAEDRPMDQLSLMYVHFLLFYTRIQPHILPIISDIDAEQ